MQSQFPDTPLDRQACGQRAHYLAPKLIAYGTLRDITLQTGLNGSVDGSQGSKPRTKA